MKTFIRSPYNYDSDEESLLSGLACKDPSLAQEHLLDETDINTIVKRFGITGELPQVSAPTYQDFDGIFDFHTAAIAIREAQESFDSMDANVRYRFNNSPADFVDFCSNPDNYHEATKLGLIFPQSEEVGETPIPTKPLDKAE